MLVDHQHLVELTFELVSHVVFAEQLANDLHLSLDSIILLNYFGSHKRLFLAYVQELTFVVVIDTDGLLAVRRD